MPNEVRNENPASITASSPVHGFRCLPSPYLFKQSSSKPNASTAVHAMPRTRTVPTATNAYATTAIAYATTAIGDATAANAADESTVMKLYSHIFTADTGLAPNPFHGYCTSALCTPSHSRGNQRGQVRNIQAEQQAF